jgi:hypothetical protein
VIHAWLNWVSGVVQEAGIGRFQPRTCKVMIHGDCYKPCVSAGVGNLVERFCLPSQSCATQALSATRITTPWLCSTTSAAALLTLCTGSSTLRWTLEGGCPWRIRLGNTLGATHECPLAPAARICDFWHVLTCCRHNCITRRYQPVVAQLRRSDSLAHGTHARRWPLACASCMRTSRCPSCMAI